MRRGPIDFQERKDPRDFDVHESNCVLLVHMNFFQHDQTVVAAVIVNSLQGSANLMQEFGRLPKGEFVPFGICLQVKSRSRFTEQDLPLADLMGTLELFTPLYSAITLRNGCLDLFPDTVRQCSRDEFDSQYATLGILPDECSSRFPWRQLIFQDDVSQSQRRRSTQQLVRLPAAEQSLFHQRFGGVSHRHGLFAAGLHHADFVSEDL
ncbi:MAG TPA: hypothetical protein EYQ75_23630 [Planctomycetaceae bacterium]|nr:hypothetical protein [Planctomycetaceae bacterium]